MPEIFETHVISAVAAALLHSFWIGAIIVSLLIIATHSSMIETPRRRYFAYLVGMFSLLYFSGFAFFLELTAVDASSEFSLQYITAGHSTFQQGDYSSALSFSWQGVVVMIWLAGMIIFACFQLMGFQRLWRTIRRATPAPSEWQKRVKTLCQRTGTVEMVRLVASDKAAVPFVYGVIRPLIVFPANYFTQLTPREIESILVHELAHISRNDFLLNIVQIAIESIMFFNPATWWLSKQIRTQREYCCDDRVWSTHSQRTYLQALYKVACMSTTPHYQPVALFQNNSELIMRVKRMSQKNEPTRSLRPLVFAALSIIAVFGLFAFGFTEDKKLEANALEAIEITHDFDIPNTALAPLELLEVTPFELTPRNLISVQSDTHPPSKRMLELQAEIEELSEEMEEISEEMEEQIEEQVESEVEKIEALAEQMEAIAEEQEEYAEREIENSPEMQRIEELSEALEEQWEEMEESIEEVNEEAIEALEEQIEAKSKAYENYEQLSSEDREKLDREMNELSKQMNAEMAELNEAHREMFENQHFKAMQDEMEVLHEQLSQKHQQLEPRNEDIQKLQEEMMVMQKAIQQKMEGSIHELQRELETRNQELMRLSEELQMEVKRWDAEHKQDK